MKKKLLISTALVLSVATLASCGGKKNISFEPSFKKLGEEITAAEFMVEWDKLENYNFEADADKTIEKTYYDTDVTKRSGYTQENKSKEVIKAAYDKDTGYTTVKNDSCAKMEFDGATITVDASEDTQIQTIGDYVYKFEKNTKLFNESSSYYIQNEFNVRWDIEADLQEETKYYKNGNVYTAVYESELNETNSDYSLKRNYSSKAQFYMTDTEVHYLYTEKEDEEYSYNESSLRQAYSVTSKEFEACEINFKLKDVSIKAVDMSKYKAGTWTIGVL